MRQELYVYYRVANENAAALRPRIEAAQARVQQLTGVSARLLVKNDEALLWMEVYEGFAAGAGFAEALEQALLAENVFELLPASARHSELFNADSG